MLKQTILGFTQTASNSSSILNLNPSNPTQPIQGGTVDKNFDTTFFANNLPQNTWNASIPAKDPIRVASPDAVVGVVLNLPWSIGYSSLTNVLAAPRLVGVASVQNNAGNDIKSSYSTVSVDP